MWIVPASDKCMPQSNPQQIRLVHANTRSRQRPAARYHAFEHLAIDRAHDFWRSHDAAWGSGHDLISLAEMPTGSLHNIGTGRAKPRIRRNGLWIIALDTGQRQCLPRKIQAADLGILIDITQDVSELKCATEMVGQRFSVAFIHTKNANTQPTNRTGHAIAIKIKLTEVWSPNIGARIHFDAVDYCQEIIFAQTETRYRVR